MQRQLTRFAGSLLAALAIVGCTADGTSPLAELDSAAAAAESRSAEDCVNVTATASGPLGLWSHGEFGGFGLVPSPITLGGVSGMMGSFVTVETISGSKGQGAHHIILSHVFWADDGVSWFRTEDTASCAPSDNNPATCQVNDHMRIVSGAGIYANAEGQLHNHGWIEFTSIGPPPAGTLDLRIKGRLCGDGVAI